MTVEVALLIAAARSALAQGLFDQALASCRTALQVQANDPLADMAAPAADVQQLMALIMERKSAPETPFRLEIIGDSLAFARPPDTRTYDPLTSPTFATPPDLTFPRLLEGALRRRLAPRLVAVDLRSRHNDGIRELNANSWVTLLYMNPTAVVMQCGVMDCWPRGEPPTLAPNVSLAEFSETLSAFLTTRHRLCPDKPFIIVGIAPTNERLLERYPDLADTVHAYNEVLRSAVDSVTHFVDLEAEVERDGADLIHPDGIHLTTAGHQRLCDLIEELIVSV